MEVVVIDNKRKLPDKEKTNIRIKYMKEMERLTAIEPQNKTAPNGLEQGNSKTGNGGKLFSKVFVWNLPPVITCPGISEWCKCHCYNADDRYDKFPLNKWCENLWWILNKSDALKEKINSQLLECQASKTAVRIHSSGDFFSKEYIIFWGDIIRRNPDVYFWSYTRSWAVEELVEDIRKLNEIDNINLILSWDETMKQPLEGFAKSIVYSSNDEIGDAIKKKDGLVCPEQYNMVPSCADCGICINILSGNIYFVLH